MGQDRLWRTHEVRRVGKPGEILELLDMAQLLLDAGWQFEVVAESLDLPTQGAVSKRERLQQMMEIAAAWPEEWLLRARQYQASWHALYEPARWWREGKVEREEVMEFTAELVDRRFRWPTIEEYRRKFGFGPTTRRPGDAKGQEALL